MFEQGRGPVILMLFLAGVINYLDRSALSVAAPYITSEFQLSTSQMGMIFSSFFIGYALFNFIGGWASDRYGAKLTLCVAMVLWSIFSGLTVLVVGFVSLLIVRVLFGMGEGPLSASTSKMVNNWFPTETRSRALGLTMSGTPLGGAISGPIVGLIAIHYGWKLSFLVIMAIGLVWVWYWQRWIRERPVDIELSRQAADIHVKAKESGALYGRPLSYFLRQPAVLFTALAFFSYNYTLFFFLSWFPSYLTMARGLSVQEMSIATVIPWLLGFIGMNVGGVLCDYIYKRTGNALLSRKLVLVSCLLACSACIVFAGIVTTAFGAIALVASAVFFLYCTGVTYWAIIQDMVPDGRVGGVGGFMHFLANTSGILGPTVTGFLIQFTGAFTSAFILAGSLTVIGALCVAIFVKPLRRVREMTGDTPPVAIEGAVKPPAR